MFWFGIGTAIAGMIAGCAWHYGIAMICFSIAGAAMVASTVGEF